MLGRPEVAADVAQDAFLRMYEGLPTIRRPGPIQHLERPGDA